MLKRQPTHQSQPIHKEADEKVPPENQGQANGSVKDQAVQENSSNKEDGRDQGPEAKE